MLAEVGGQYHVIRTDFADYVRHILQRHLLPVFHPRVLRIRSGHRLQVAILDVRAHLRDLFRLRQGQAGDVGQRVRNEDIFNAQLFCAFDHGHHFLGMDMAGGEDQVFPRDDLQYGFNLRGHDIAGRDLDAGTFRVHQRLDVHVGIEGRQPDHLAASAGHAVHPFHRRRVDAADGIVQDDAAEDFNTRHDFHHQHRAIGGHSDMVLEHEAAHALAFGEDGDIDVVHAAPEHVGFGVDVEVDGALGGTGFRRRGGEADLRK